MKNRSERRAPPPCGDPILAALHLETAAKRPAREETKSRRGAIIPPKKSPQNIRGGEVLAACASGSRVQLGEDERPGTSSAGTAAEGWLRGQATSGIAGGPPRARGAGVGGMGGMSDLSHATHF